MSLADEFTERLRTDVDVLRAQRDSAHSRADELAHQLADYRRAWELCQERIDEQDRLIRRLRRAWLRCSQSREALRVPLDAEQVAQAFHEAYESLAPSFGYVTHAASAVPWSEVPERNRMLMIATVREVLGVLG